MNLAPDYFWFFNIIFFKNIYQKLMILRDYRWSIGIKIVHEIARFGAAIFGYKLLL